MLHIAPAMRGRGLGRALPGALSSHAAEAGGHRLSGATPGARADYLARGHAAAAVLPEVGRLPGRRLDSYPMMKAL